MEGIRLERKGPAAIITVDRPEVRNAIDESTAEALAEAIRECRQDPAVRGIVITGAGDRAFISGGDVKQYLGKGGGRAAIYAVMSRMRYVLEQIYFCPKPVVAAARGAVRGGGAEVLAACHWRLGTPDVSVGFVQVTLGIVPGWGGGSILVRRLGEARALPVLLDGEVYNGEEAVERGLLDELVPGDELLERAVRQIERWARWDAAAVAGLLSIVRSSGSLEQAMDFESKMCSSLWGREAHLEAMRPFLSKRGKK
ncbi:MAG: enoyl-CoA hydratase/isomerase family protein [Kyrpidia tusciae]|nr:enoyl-CoA hydratase/isomerase family protein [Kyrpidia tusciae]MBE3551695.1 enoyl-CoA hydratase/isomerase family protein [Kyrpidia tusciae]